MPLCCCDDIGLTPVIANDEGVWFGSVRTFVSFLDMWEPLGCVLHFCTDVTNGGATSDPQLTRQRRDAGGRFLHVEGHAVQRRPWASLAVVTSEVRALVKKIDAWQLELDRAGWSTIGVHPTSTGIVQSLAEALEKVCIHFARCRVE